MTGGEIAVVLVAIGAIGGTAYYMSRPVERGTHKRRTGPGKGGAGFRIVYKDGEIDRYYSPEPAISDHERYGGRLQRFADGAWRSYRPRRT